MDWKTGKPEASGWYIVAWSYPLNRRTGSRGYATEEVFWINDRWEFDDQTDYDPAEDQIDYWSEMPSHPDAP